MFENLISTVEAAAMNLRDKVVYDVVYPAQIGLDSLMGKSYTPRAESDITDPDEIAKLYQSDVIERIDINNSKIGFSKRYRKYWLSQLEKELAEDVEFVGEDEYTEPWENLLILSISDEEKEEILSRYKNKPIYAKMRKRLYYYDYLDDELEDGKREPLMLATDETNSPVKQITETYVQSLGSKPGVMEIILNSAGLWPEAVCRYAVYLFDEETGSMEWHNLNADGLSVDIDKFTHIIFCALQKESTNAWENVLFQTALIKLPQFAKAEFKLTGMDTNQGNKFVGKWVNIQSFVAETPKKEDKVMTFNSAGLWPEAICRYAAYFTDKNNSAHSAWRDVEADGKVVILEDGYTDVIFCGLPKNEKKNSFANAIFRTGNIELPKASGAVYKLTNVDVSDNNKYVGEWQNTNVAPPKKISTNITKGVYDNNDTVSESKSRFGKGLYGNNDVAPKSKSRFASGIYNNNEAYGAKVNTMVEKPKSSSGSLSNETYVPSRQLGKGLF